MKNRSLYGGHLFISFILFQSNIENEFESFNDFHGDRNSTEIQTRFSFLSLFSSFQLLSLTSPKGPIKMKLYEYRSHIPWVACMNASEK